MGSIDFLMRRADRLVKAADSLKEVDVLLRMREEEGDDTSEDRTKLSEELDKNKVAFDSTMKALEELKVLEEKKKEK